MIETSARHDPILLVHSSCMENDKAKASSNKVHISNDTRSDLSISRLLREDIFCDLLLMPEHPPSSFAQHDYLNLPENPLNPCGISNVLTLEELPQNWISGPILLSLSSCNIFYRESEVGDDKSTTNQIPLMVEATPSTFVLDFSSNHDMEGNADEADKQWELHNSSIVTVKSMAEIFVEFDVLEASIQAKDLLRQENSTRIDAFDDNGESRLENRPKHSSSTTGITDKEIEDLLIHHDNPTHTAFQYESCKLNLHGSNSCQDLKEQVLMIAQMNVQLDQGTKTIDIVLIMSGFFCIVSMAALIWAIYQYYRTAWKSDLFSEEIRERMAKTHDMLQAAMNELNQHYNYDVDQLPPRKEYPMGEISVQQNVAISLDSQKREPDPTTPTRDNIVTDTHAQDTNSEAIMHDESQIEDISNVHGTDMKFASEIISPPVQFTDTIAQTKEGVAKKLCFLKFVPSLHGDSLRTSCDSLSRMSTKGLNHVTNLDLKRNEETGITEFERKTTSDPLSPCSQLEKEWNEGKTVRRGNLKNRRQFLTPVLESTEEPKSTSAANAWKDDGDKSLFESTILSLVPKKSKLYERYCKQQQLSYNLLPPPGIRSTTRIDSLEGNTNMSSSSMDHVGKENTAAIEIDVLDGMNIPPFDMTLQRVPRLCHTPESDDDSFINDYW